MNQIHTSVDGLVATKENLAKIENTRQEFVVPFKWQQAAVEKADRCAVLPSSPSSSSPATPKPSLVADPAFSSRPASKLRVASRKPPAAQKPSSATALPRKRPSPLRFVPTLPSRTKKRPQFVVCLPSPKPSSAVEPSLNSSAAAHPKLLDDYTLTCCTSWAARRPRLYAPKPLSVATTPPPTVVPFSAAPPPSAQSRAASASSAYGKCNEVRFR